MTFLAVLVAQDHFERMYKKKGLHGITYVTTPSLKDIEVELDADMIHRCLKNGEDPIEVRRKEKDKKRKKVDPDNIIRKVKKKKGHVIEWIEQESPRVQIEIIEDTPNSKSKSHGHKDEVDVNVKADNGSKSELKTKNSVIDLDTPIVSNSLAQPEYNSLADPDYNMSSQDLRDILEYCDDEQSRLSLLKLELRMFEETAYRITELIKTSTDDYPDSDDIKKISVDLEALLARITHMQRETDKEPDIREETPKKTKDFLDLTQNQITPSMVDEIDKHIYSYQLDQTHQKNFNVEEVPSFNLWLSQPTQDDDINTEIKSPLTHVTSLANDEDKAKCDKGVINEETPKPLEMVNQKEKKVGYEERPKRATVLTNVLRSPFVQRQVVLGVKRTRLEESVSEYIFSATGEEWDIVFSTTNGGAVMRVLMETLCPGVAVHVSVISSWSKFLNYQEKFKQIKSPSRLFCSGVMLFNVAYDVHVTSENRIAEFTSNMESVLAAENMTSIMGVDLVFIPMVYQVHYYLLCFNLKTVRIDLIDNSAHDIPFKDKYQRWPEIMRATFGGYLRSVSHPNWKQIKSTPIIRMEMTWRTLYNNVDCGIFLMRHMETYFGTDSRDWQCGLSNESDEQLRELTDLRHKYVSKLLSWDLNTEKYHVMNDMKQYQKLNAGARKALKESAVSRIVERLKAHVD